MRRPVVAAGLIAGLAALAAPPSHAKPLESTAVEVGPGIEPPGPGGILVRQTPDGVSESDAHATVTVRLLIDKHGRTRKATAVDPPSVPLGTAAAAAFEGSNWRPATQDRKAVVVRWNRKVRFRPKAELDAENPPPDCVAAATDRVYDEELTDDIEWPRLLESATPEYPRDALNERDSGRAGVRCVLDTCGRVRDCTVMFVPRTSFGQATQKAAMRRRYAPARRDGQPIAIEITIVSDFHGP